MSRMKSEIFRFDDLHWSVYEIEKVRTEAEACRDEHKGELEFLEGHLSFSASYGCFYCTPECWPKYIVYWEEEYEGYVVTYGGEPIRDSDLKVMVFDDMNQAESYVRQGFPESDKIEIRPVLGRCVRCGSPLVHSDFDGYYCQCYDCDEDFYAVEQNLEQQAIEK